MNRNLPESALAAVGTAVVTSVIVSWTLTTFTLGRIDREMDQIHRAIRYEYAPEYMMPDDVMGDAAAEDVPEAPEL